VRIWDQDCAVSEPSAPTWWFNFHNRTFRESFDW